MPYRLDGNCVQVEENGRWKDKKCYDNKKDAKAYLTALNMNAHKEYTGSNEYNRRISMIIKNLRNRG
jgi:hypothetical protein